MPELSSLLSRGYFPAELPPPFSTTSFSEAIINNIANLPDGITKTKKPGKTVVHNLARVGTLKRTLAIPNPIHQFRIANEIINGWDEITSIINGASLSKSKPIDDPSERRALKREKGLEELPLQRAHSRATSKFILKTDLSRFYHSIYTHAIPWAIDGKQKAKKNKDNNPTLGSLLDIALREGQDGQTLGIPVGPDTSLVIAELLLAQVDKSLNEQIEVNGFRYMDDYELSFNTRSGAENTLTILEDCLADYELSLNPTKTAILENPVSLGHSWAFELQVFQLREDDKHQLNDIIRIFDRAFELARRYPTDSVLKYCISRLSAIDVKKESWEVIQDLTLQCMVSEPGVLPKAVEMFISHRDKGNDIDINKLGMALNVIIKNRSHSRLGSEVAWAIWACIVFEITIPEIICQTMAKFYDPVVTLLLLDAQNQGLTESKIDLSGMKHTLTTDGLYGRDWLLSYEARIKEWLPSVGMKNHINSDPAFNFLQKQNVTFYDCTAKERTEYTDSTWTSIYG